CRRHRAMDAEGRVTDAEAEQMTKTTDEAALDQWYAVETSADLGSAPIRTRLLGQDIELRRDARSTPAITEVYENGTRGPPLQFLPAADCGDRAGGRVRAADVPGTQPVRGHAVPCLPDLAEPSRRHRAFHPAAGGGSLPRAAGDVSGRRRIDAYFAADFRADHLLAGPDHSR